MTYPRSQLVSPSTAGVYHCAVNSGTGELRLVNSGMVNSGTAIKSSFSYNHHSHLPIARP